MPDSGGLLGLGNTPVHDYDLEGSRPDDARRGPAAGMFTVLAALLVGFLLTTGMSAGREQAMVQFERKDELIALIEERHVHAEALRSELDELRGRVDSVQAEAAAGVPALQREIHDIELAAGLVDLRGPGLRVTLADAPSGCPSTPHACRILDADLQLAVNALFDAGAEAVAVGGERVTATTAIRAVGQTIRINNLTVLTGPYRLDAIGDPASLHARFAASGFADDFQQWTSEYGLGFTVDVANELEIPRFTGTLGMDTRPAETLPDR